MILSVGIVTYNHHKYIKQCLESVLAQETTFRYEIVICDDCSHDGTSEIIEDIAKNNPNRIKHIRNTQNIGIFANYKLLLQSCSGEYIALLEGDDYWPDRDKLEIQVSFLNTHPEVGFVGSGNYTLSPNGKLCEEQFFVEQGIWVHHGNVFSDAIINPVARTCTLVFRYKLILPFIEHEGAGCDIVLQTILASQSEFAYYTKPLGVWRQTGVSSSSRLKNKLSYWDYYTGCRLLQKKLFPSQCNWDLQQLTDGKTYIILKDAILHFRITTALKEKRGMVTELYRKKFYCRHLHGMASGLLLSTMMRINSHKRSS